VTRPLINLGVSQLEVMATRNATNDAELKLILSELRHRKVPRARKVEDMIKRMLSAAEPVNGKAETERKDNLGKYAEVHREAEAVGSPVRLGWKYRDAWFRYCPGGDYHAPASVYGTIFAIAKEAGLQGLSAADLATELRKRQVGNARSSYCDGMPPIGWAEGWIDTAVSNWIIKTRNPPKAQPSQDKGVEPSAPAPQREPEPGGSAIERLGTIEAALHGIWSDRDALANMLETARGIDIPRARKLEKRVAARLHELSEGANADLHPVPVPEKEAAMTTPQEPTLDRRGGGRSAQEADRPFQEEPADQLQAQQPRRLTSAHRRRAAGPDLSAALRRRDGLRAASG
jgi:hypothetical protein